MSSVSLKALRYKNLIDRREDDLKELVPSQNVYKDVDEYVKIYRALLLEEFDIDCENKRDLHKDFELNFTLLYENKNDIVWETKIPVEDDSIRPDVTGKSKISTTDEVILTWPDKTEETGVRKVFGKIEKILREEVFITLKLPRNECPPDYNTQNRVLYGIDFVPSTLVLNRKLVALEYLKYLPDDSFIKKTIIGNIPENVADPSKFNGNLDGIPLTPTQRRIAEESATRLISVVQGPPGCGKTHTIGATMVACLQQNPDEKILICGTSNASVENLIRVIGRDAETIGKSMVWLAAENRDFVGENNLKEEQKYQMYYKMLKDNTSEGKSFYQLQKKKWSGDIKGNEIYKMKKLRKKLESKIAQESNVVLSTLDVAGKSCLDAVKFETVIIDEATQANEPSTIVPLIHGAKRWILVGDQQQLGPVGDVLEEYNYNTSFFQRLINELEFPYDFLDSQWRMHPLICKFPNENFYGGKIQNMVTEDDRKLTTCTIPNNICFVDVDGVEKKQGFSYYNIKEKDEVEQIVSDMVRDGVKPSDIGIISPYAQQAREIRKDIYFYKNLIISTVDSFQGSEKEYIIVSAVRTSEETLGFLRVYNRLNVTVTRARRGLVIVGNAKALEKDKIWGSFIELCKETPNSFFKDHLPYSGVTLNTRNIIGDEEIYDERGKREIKPPETQKNGLELLGKGVEVPLYKNNYSKDITEVLSTVTNTKVRVLWPDVGSDMEYLRKWVAKRVELLNNDKNVTLSYDSECVCLQFGDVFPDNFDIFKWKNYDPIPIINTEEGIIVFFFNKSDDQLNFTTPCTILKPLLEHRRVTILTFDFLREIDTMNQFNIDINTDRILDGQVLYTKRGNTEMIKTTFNKGLEGAIAGMKNKDPIAETAIEVVKNNGKKFPWDENSFLIQYYNLAITANVSETFLEYSANDIFFTALIIVEAMKQNRVNMLILNTDIKMVEYINNLEVCPLVSMIRDAEYCRNDHTAIINGKIAQGQPIPLLLYKWKQLCSYYKLIRANNEEINKILRINDDVRETVSNKLALVTDILSTKGNLKRMKFAATLSPTKIDYEKDIEVSNKLIDILRKKLKDNEQENSEEERNEGKRVYITFTNKQYKLFKEINESVPTIMQGIPIIIEDLQNKINDFEKILVVQKEERAKAEKEAEISFREFEGAEQRKKAEEENLKSRMAAKAQREKLKREKKSFETKRELLNSLLSTKANLEKVETMIKSKLSKSEKLVSKAKKGKKKNMNNNKFKIKEFEKDAFNEAHIKLPQNTEQANRTLQNIQQKHSKLCAEIEENQRAVGEMQIKVSILEDIVKTYYKDAGLDYNAEMKENQMKEEGRRRKMEERAKREEMEEKARLERRREKARNLIMRREKKIEENIQKAELRAKQKVKREEEKRVKSMVDDVLKLKLEKNIKYQNLVEKRDKLLKAAPKEVKTELEDSHEKEDLNTLMMHIQTFGSIPGYTYSDEIFDLFNKYNIPVPKTSAENDRTVLNIKERIKVIKKSGQKIEMKAITKKMNKIKRKATRKALKEQKTKNMD